jgi:predicted ABC-type transport system involved in lysophospholipase L1 biosynthesis ATPase subunit
VRPFGQRQSTWPTLAAGLLTHGAGELRVAGQAVATLKGGQRVCWRTSSIGFLPQKLLLSNPTLCAGRVSLKKRRGSILFLESEVLSVADNLRRCF